MKGTALAAYFLIAASLLFVAHADQHFVDVRSDGETVVTSSSMNHKVRVAIQTHEVDIGKPSDQRPTVIRSSCTYSRYPCSIVDTIDINVNGRSIYVPRSVYSDLSDLSNVEIQVGQKGSVLTLKGGDASESYIVQIGFDRQRVTKRTLSSTISAKTPLQETVYHKVVVGH